MENRDLSNFDKNVMEMFDVCKEILKISDKRNISVSDRKNPYLSRLEKYIRAYSKTDPDEHVVYFERIYTNNKRFILLGPQRDSWLIDGNHIISFGEDAGIKTDMKLHLSGIYSTAVKIRDEIREELQGLPNSSDTFETGFPSKYMLILYRIFREVASSDNEKTKLTAHIESLESDAGVRSNSSDPFAGILEAVGPMVEQMTGSKMPKDSMPKDLGKMFSSMMDNPKAKSMLGSVMQGLQNPEKLGELATSMIGSLGNMNSGSNTSEASTTSEAPAIESNDNVNDEFADYN